jgi:sec-independent protein translocase protein TatC
MRLRPRRLQYGEEATLVEHLDELRSRLVVALVAFIVGFGIAYGFRDRIMNWLTRPLPPAHRHDLLTIGVTEPFFTTIKVCLWAAFVLALPFLLWQIWSFLAPAVEEGSQRVIVSFVALGTALFAVGIMFAYWVVLHPALAFLTSYEDNLYNVQVRASSYFTFVSSVLLAIGIVFELPIFVLALVRLGILTSDRLRKNRRIGYVIAFAVAVALPTVDPVSLFFETVPLLVLFESSIWLAVFFERRWGVRDRLEALPD